MDVGDLCVPLSSLNGRTWVKVGAAIPAESGALPALFLTYLPRPTLLEIPCPSVSSPSGG